MKCWIAIFIVFFFSCKSYGQLIPDSIPGLKTKFASSPADTSRVLLLSYLSESYNTVNLDSSYFFATEAHALSLKLGYKRGLASAHLCLGSINFRRGNVSQSIDNLEKAIHLADSLKDYNILSRGLSHMGLCMVYLEDYHRAIEYFKRSLEYQKKTTGKNDYTIMIMMNLADANLDNNNLKEADYYLKSALALGEEKNPDYGWLLNMFGSWHLDQKSYSAADSVLNLAWKKTRNQLDIFNKADNRYYFAKLKFAKGELQSAYEYAQEALGYYRLTGFKFDLERIYKLLSSIESKRGKTQQSLDYLLLSNALRDSTQNSRARNRALLFEQHEKERLDLLSQKEKELQHAESRNQQLIAIGSLLTFCIVTVGLSFLIWQKQRSNRQLIKTNQLVVEANASKDKLFSIIGHDLKGPLNSLTRFSSLLSDDTDRLSRDEIKTLARDLDKSLNNLFALLENLLQWSQSQRGDIDFKPNAFDLGELLKENQELFQGLAENKKIMIINDTNSILLVNAHRNSINTILRNLISNGVKFTPVEGVITLQAKPIGKYLKVSVTDTGLGISESAIQKLFTIGTKHSTLGTAKEKGTGLGLAICKDFVEKNGGTIGVESVEGKGSTFYFTVPLAN